VQGKRKKERERERERERKRERRLFRHLRRPAASIRISQFEPRAGCPRRVIIVRNSYSFCAADPAVTLSFAVARLGKCSVHLRRCGFLAAAFVDVGILITRRASTRLLRGFHNEHLSRSAGSALLAPARNLSAARITAEIESGLPAYP